MWKIIARKKRLLTACLSVLCFATAFTQNGCTITIDEDLVNQLVDWAESYQPYAASPGEFDDGRMPWSEGWRPPCDSDCPGV